MNTEQIRSLLEQDKLIIGLRETKRKLAKEQLSAVLVAANAPEQDAEAMRDYAEMSDVECTVLDTRNDQLGTICRKPFPISFIGVKK